VVPATENFHAVGDLLSEGVPAARALLPFRVIGEGGDHLDGMALPLQKLAQGGIVGADPGQLRRVVNSPDNNFHGGCRARSAAFRLQTPNIASGAEYSARARI